MTIEIPPELEWVSYLAGSEWPQGDEDAMFRIGGHWRNSADDLAKLIPDLNRVRQETIASLSGETATAADEQFKKLFDGDFSVDKLVDAMAAVGDLAWDQGTQIEYTKLQVLSTLAIVAAEIAWAIYNSWETLGASLAWIPTFEGFGIAVIRQIANEFLKRIRIAITEAATKAFAVKALKMAGTGALHGVGIGLGQELAIQLYQDSEGHRHGINWGQVGKVALGGAVGGAAGALAHGPLATAFGPSNSVVGKAVKGTVVAFGSGVAGGVGGALAAGGGLDGKSIFGGAAGGAGSGAVHGAAGHGGEVHPTGGGPDGGPVKVPPPKVDVPHIDIKPDGVGPDTNLPEPPPPYSNVDSPPPTSSTAGPSDGGQNSAVAPGSGAGPEQNGASQDGAGQNSGAGQQKNGASAGQGNGSGQSGASQNGAAQNNGASGGQSNGSGQSGVSQNGAGQSNGASTGQNSGAGQQNTGASGGQSNGSGQSGVSQNGAGQSNGASTGQNSGAGQQNTGASAGQSNGSGQSGVSQNGAAQSNGASTGQNSGAGQQNTGASAGQSNGSGQSGVSQNGAGQSNGASTGQNSGAGQQNNGASAGQSNGSGQSGVSQNGAGQSNGAATAQNGGAGQPNNGSSTGQQSAQVGDGSRPPGARPNAAGMDGRGPGAGATQLSATPHTDTRPASAGSRNFASESTGGPNAAKAVHDSASDGPQSNSTSRPPSTGKPDAGREVSKSQEKDQPAVKESADPRTSPAGPQGNRRPADGISSRPVRTSDSSTPEKHQHAESNAPKRLFIGSSSHDSSTATTSSAGPGHSGGTRASSPDVDPYRHGEGGGTRASSPDVDPHRDDAGPSREEQVHSRPLPSPPDVVPHRGGAGGGTRASSPDVDPHRDDAGPSREEQVHSRPLPSPPDVVPHRDDAGPSREEQVHSRPLPSPPDVVPHRGGEGGTRASSPDVDPHRDDAGPSREEQVHSRPLPSPPDVPVLAPLGASNTSIHWIRSWIRDVNPGYDAAPVGDPRRRNCTSASIAVFRHLSGTSNDPAGLEQLYSHQVTEITDLPLVPTTLDQVEQALRDAGPGSHTIVAARFDGRPSHAFNAYFDGRDVHGLDGQSGVDEFWPPDSYIFHPAHPPTQLFMGTPFHGTREQLMRGNPDLSEENSSDSRSGHDSGAPNPPPRDQMQANHPTGSNHTGTQPASSGSGDHAMPPGASGQDTSHGSTLASADSVNRRSPPGGAPGDPHGSGAPGRPHDAGAGGPGRDARPAPIAGPDNGSGPRGDGVRNVPGGDSGSGLKRGRDDSGDSADSNSDVSRHGKRARIDTDAASEVADPNRHSDTDMDVDRDGHHGPVGGSSRDTHPHTVDGDGDDGMVVDHVDRGPGPGPSQDTHSHTTAVDDVVMGDDTPHGQIDDLARRLGDLQVDEKTQFNSKFADLVSTAKGADSTADNVKPGNNPYDDYLQTSVDENRPISFVVNAIVGADPVPDLKGFVDAVTNNAKDLHGKVAFVIGVNAKNTPEGRASVDKALADMKPVLDTLDHPVALVRIPWSSSDLKYGTLRNNTMHSEANRLASDALWSKGSHPYIAVQDFDTGSRNVPSGKHIFNHVIDSMTVGEGLPPSRPLMFGGGYRLGDDGRRNLVADTEARRARDLAKTKSALDKIPVKKKELATQKKDFETQKKELAAEKKKLEKPGKTAARGVKGKGSSRRPERSVDVLQGEITKLDKKINEINGDKQVEEVEQLEKEIAKLEKAKDKIANKGFVEDFERRITQDMDTRAVLAKTSPLLPYTPEPNLFVDAIATKLHSDIKFGDGGAEFSHLGKKLQDAYAKELGKLDDDKIDDIRKKIAETVTARNRSTGQGSEAPMTEEIKAKIAAEIEARMTEEIKEQRSNLEVQAQNNLHPVRGEVFITDFEGAAVETDLTRIALGYAKDSMVPQSHTDLTGVADRFFDGKPAKKGTSYSGFRDEFPNHPGELREPTNLALNDKGVPKRTYTPDDPTVFVRGKGGLPAKTVTEALGLREGGPGQGEKKHAEDAAEKKATTGRGKKREELDQRDKEEIANPLSKSISTPVPSRHHQGVVAGISPQPKKSPAEKTLDHHKAFAAVNTAMSGPEALMQRTFGALKNIGELPETLPPAKGGLFDTLASPMTGTPAELRRRVTHFVSSLTSSAGDTRISKKLADFITDHPTTNGDLVNAIIQPSKPPGFVSPPARQHDPKTAANADHIAVQALATTLSTPIHVDAGGPEPEKYTPFGKEPSKGWPNPIKVYATKQASGRYTYSHEPPASASSARRARPAPVPSAGAVESHSGGGVAGSKVLHQSASGSSNHHTASGTVEPPSDTASSSGSARVVRGGGAPPRLDPPTGPRGDDVLADETWRHDPAASADWFDPKGPASQDEWVSRRVGAHVRTVNTVVADITSDSTPTKINAYDGRINYDLRRIEVAPEKYVQDYTLKVHLTAGSGVDAGTVEAVQAKAKVGVDGLLNQGFRMPSGDQFHVNLEFTDDPKQAHTAIEVGGAPTDQTHWNPASSPNVLAHETLHYLGVPDEYSDRGRVLLAHDTNSGVHRGDGGMMGRDVLGDDPGLRPRHLWLVERTANSQVAVPNTRLDKLGPVAEGTSAAPNPNAHHGESRPAPKRPRDDSDGDGGPNVREDSGSSKRVRTDAGVPPRGAAPTRLAESDMDVDVDKGVEGMDVDHGTVSGMSPDDGVDTPHTDVEMTDRSLATDADVLVRPLESLQLDASTKLNPKFADLVRDARPTAANGDQVKHTYDDYPKTSVAEDRPVSFVVNTIVGVSEVHNLKAFVEKVMENAEGLHSRVAFVVGVNAEGARGDRVLDDPRLADVLSELDAIDHPVALTGFTWKMPSTGHLPYGTLRNETMHSDVNRLAIDAMWSKGNHPYIAVQDFDTGSRNVPSGKHIFNHVIDSMTVGEGLPPSRPLMFGGGYRMGDGAKLVTDTVARLDRQLAKAERDLQASPADKKALAAKTKLTGARAKILEEGFVEDFDRQITQDMDTRVELAKTSPMLPYTPEPNLFVDAIAIRVHPEVRFGDRGAEFSQLGRSLHALHAKELGQSHDNEIAAIDTKIKELEKQEHPLDEETMERLNELREQMKNRRSDLSVEAQNNLHPIRGEVFITDFKGAAVETDLSRIALGYATDHKVPQSHTALTNVAERFVDGKAAKAGTSPSGYRDAFPIRAADEREPTNLEMQDGIPVRTFTAGDQTAFTVAKSNAPAKTLKEALGLDEETNPINRSISTPVPNHDGVVAGIDPANPGHKAFAAVNMAMSGPEALMQRTFGGLNHFANLASTSPAPGGLFDAAQHLVGADSTELRRDVTEYVSSLSSSTAHAKIRGDLADFITDHPTTNGDLVNAIVQPDKPPTFEWPAHWSPREEDWEDIQPTFLDPLDESQLAKVREDAQQEKVEQQKANTVSAANAEAIAVQVLATKLQSPIHVHEAGKTTTFEPLGKTPKGRANPALHLYATKQLDGRSTYSHEPPASAGSARQTRPAPTSSTPSASAKNPHSSDGVAALDPKTLHDNGSESNYRQNPTAPEESPSEVIVKAFGAQRSSLERSLGAPGDGPANWLDHFGNPTEAPTADRGQRLIEARNAEERLEAGLSEGRQHIAELSGRLEHVDGQIADQHGVVEEANRRLAGAVDHLHRLQANERSIAEHGVDAMARQHAADLTRTQLSAVQAEEERARTERNSLVQLESELANMRQHGDLYQQRLREVEAELTDVGRSTVEASNVEQQLSTAVLEGREHVTGLRRVLERVDEQVTRQRAVVEDADRGLASASHDMQHLQDQVRQVLAHGADADTWRHAVEAVRAHQLLVDRAHEHALAQRDGLVRLQGESAHAGQQLTLNEQHLREFEVELANASQRTIEARTLEQQLSATVLSGRDQIAEISGRVQQLDSQVMNQRHVVEEADHRLADAHGVLHQLQTQERLIAERPVDENTRRRAAEQTQSQQRVADAEQERALGEHGSLERLNAESALMRQQLAHDEQRLAEVEAQLSRARQDTAELARPQVISRERFPEHSLEAIRLFRDNYPQLRDLNAVHFNAGVQDHMHNCVNVVVSTFETLSGRRMVPHGAPSGRSGDLLIEHFDREHHMVSGPQEIVETLVQAGPGSHGVVFQHRARGEGHVFNALYDERLNSVVFIDAQNGRLGSFNPNDRYGFMLVTGDDPHAPGPMDVDTAFGGPKIDSTNVSHESSAKNNVGHGFGDNLDERHRPSAEGNSHKRKFEPNEASTSRVTATEPPHESSGGAAPPTRSSLSGVPSAAPSRDSSGAPVARTADAAAGKAETVNRPTQPDLRKPDPQLPARIGDHLVLGGTDVVEEFRSGEEGARDQGFEYIKQLVLSEGGEEVWQKNEMDVYGLFSDRGLRPEVPGMLRGGQTVKHVIHLTKDRSLTVELRLDGADDRSELRYREEFKDEFEHTSDSASSLGRSVQSRVVYHAGIQGSVSHSATSDTSALIASRAHDSGLTEVRTDRQISGAQTAETATRFSGRIQASILHRFSDSPKVVHEHELAYHTQVAVPTRDVNDRGGDGAPTDPPDGPTAPPKVEYTRALSGSDVVTNLWLLPDQHDSAQPKHGAAEPGAKSPRGPRPQKIPEFVMDTPMRAAFEKAYGKGSAQLAIDEAGKWLTVERLQANLHGMTNKQPLVLELESIPGARLEVHAFVEPLDTVADTKSAAGDGDVTKPAPARRMMRATGETKETEFHFGTETDTSQARMDAVTVTYQAPAPGRVRGQGGTDTGEATGGVDANVARGNVHTDTETEQFRIRSTLKNPAAGQAWHGQARLRFVMHAPDAVSPSHRDAPFKGAVHETRARFDVLAEKSETTPTLDYTNETVYAPPERIWGVPPGERNSVAKSPWWRIGTGHRTVRTQDGGTRPAYEPAPESILRDEETAQLRGLGSMDRVTNLDVSGLHGMLDSMGRRAFGNDWKDVRSEVSSWHHLNRIRAALPAMTQHSPLTRTKLSGPNSKTKVSFTADIEQLTYKRTIKTLSSPSMEITEGSASTTERNGQVSVQGALGGRGGDVNGGSVLGEAMAGATETVRDSERVRDQQRVAVGTKFDQPMAIFEGWVRLDGTMTGSKSTVHESGLFPVEIAIPLTELQGSRTHDFKLPPTFTRDSQSGFIDEPRPKPPRDPVDQAPQPKNPFTPKSIGHRGGQPRLPSPLVRGVDDRDAPDPGLADAADGFKQLPAVKLPPPGWEWTAPERMEEPPEPPAHALLGSWHPSDMLIGLDPASGLLEAMRHDLAPALGSSLDDAVDSLANQFGPRVLAARLTHQSGQAWSHDIPAAGGMITVKVRPVRLPEPAKYIGTSSKFETDLSIESQSSAAQGHGASLRTNEGFRVQVPIPHGSVSFGGQHTGTVRPKEDPDATRLSGLNTPTYTGEIEHRVPVRTRATEAHDLFRQRIHFEISYEKHGPAQLLKDIPKSPRPVRLDGVFSYPKKAPTAVDSANAGPPPAKIEVHQAVVKIRPHDGAASTADADSRRTADEDQMATHILESMAERGKEIYGEKWPSVRAELTKHVKTMAIQGKLGDYTRGERKTISLTSVRGGKVVLGAHLDTMNLADSNATTEFYSGGQQLLTAGVSKNRGNNWQGFIQAQADLLPTGDTVNVSALARLGGAVGSETQDTRTNNTATGTLFRKKVPTVTHVGTVTINADMSRPGGDGRISGVASAKVEFVTRESPPDKQAHANYVPRAGIIQNGSDGGASHSDEQRGQDDADLPQRGLSDKSIVRKLIDGENFRGVTLERLHHHEIKDASEVVDGLTDTLVASKLGDMTRVDKGDGIQLVRHGNVRIYGRAAVQKLDFARIEHEGGNAYVLNDVNQTRLDQHTATLEGNVRLMFGPHGELAPGVSAYLLAGGGVGGRRRVDAISSQAARVAANEKFARSHAVFDGTTRITLTVRDGETRHELEPINVRGTILIPESETRPADPPAPAVSEPKEEVPEEFWLGALAAQWAESGDEPAANPPRASLSAESHRSRIPSGSPIARTVENTPEVSRS